ncbi:MAG: hypothetical protein D3913_06775 [Candidatus Electrothrix sp. LOE1_4_5]|nr:hypothetical protein [Candidatus Electrothrix gigas]
MKSKLISFIVGRNITLLYVIFSILGISFWFFIGFPFDNHNESYTWITEINQLSIKIPNVLLWSPTPLVNYRPLGTMTVLLGFILSDGSIYPQQIFNFIIAILAWLILYFAVTEKKLFSLVAFITGGVFFSGYIYLFHLHGVFYSPLLVFVAILIGISIRNIYLSSQRLAATFVLAVLASLYHPFALLIYSTFILGYFFEKRDSATRIEFAIGGLSFAVSLILIKVLVPTGGTPSSEWALGLSTSYKMLELKQYLSIVSCLLSIATLLSLSISRQTKVIASIIVTTLSLGCVLLNQPTLFIWIIVCLIKTVFLRKWSLLLLVSSTAILPIATATGSPTYAIFSLMVCSAVFSFRWSLPTIESPFFDRIVLTILIITCSIGMLIKSDIYLPVITKLATPLLAEKEKTFQLENILNWWQASKYTQYRLVFCQSSGAPRSSSNAINRTHRPPTDQKSLDIYTESLVPQRNRVGQLLVCFGNEKIKAAEAIYAVPGKYNGQALVQQL